MQLIGYIISTFFPMYIEGYCFDKTLHRRNISTPMVYTVYTLAAVLLTLQNQFAYSMVLNPIANILVMFALTFMYKDVWYQRLFFSFAMFVVGVMGEGTSVLIVQFFFTPTDLTQVSSQDHFIEICLLGVLCELVYMVIIYRIIHYFQKHTHNLRMFILFLIAVLTYGVILLFVTFAGTAYLFAGLVLAVLLIAAIAGCLYLFSDQLRVERERLQLAHLEEIQRDQMQHYTALYEASRQSAVQRHDWKNILLNARSYLRLGEYDKLDAYLAGFQQKMQPAALIDNGMPFIDAVLSAKMAGQPEIPFDLHISLLDLKHISQSQIAFVLASALDNAIEACQQSAKPFIKVALGQKDRMVSLVVENAADQPVKSVGGRLLTTKPNTASHGFGIKTMQQTAEQAHGMLTWKHENGTFTLSVLFQDR